jgi:hypothetical protein
MKIKMDEEEFYIDFMFRGRNYTGLVATRQRDGISSFVVRYSMEPAHLIENTIELLPVVCEESEPLEWHEIPDTITNKFTEYSLIRVIGDSLEGRDI